jgi:small subunit ribosomal protein S21
MIVIQLKDGENIERALKKFKRKFEKTGVMREVRERQAYTKPSMEKREKKKKAIYRQKLREQEE